MNKLENELLNYTDGVEARYIKDLLESYLLKKFGEEYFDLKGVCSIQPEELCKLIQDEDTYFKICQIIAQFKINNKLDIGFDIKRYNEVYKEYQTKIERKKQKYRDHRKRIVRKQIIEDFPENNINKSLDEFINFLKLRNEIKIIEPHKAMKDYTNYRQGKIAFLIPYKKFKPNPDEAIWWICKCDCGNYFALRNNNIKNKTSCGKCVNEQNYIGKKHDNLKVLDQKMYFKNINSKGELLLKVECKCGNIVIMSVDEFNTKKFCNNKCQLLGDTYSKISSNNNALKKVFYKGTNIYKLDKKNETDITHNNTSGYLGVHFNKLTKKYLAYITFRGKYYRLGEYGTASYASKVRQQAQAILYKDYAKTVRDDEFIKNNKYLSRLIENLSDSGEVNEME